MRTTRILLAVAYVGGVALCTLASAQCANAQYYPPPPDYGYDYPPPDYGYDYPPPGYGYGYPYGYRTWNGCPPGYTVQGGNCAPYQGAVGGGWRTWNGCPPGYTIQGGQCQPYRGR
jgi:hypothetical protein